MVERAVNIFGWIQILDESKVNSMNGYFFSVIFRNAIVFAVIIAWSSVAFGDEIQTAAVFGNAVKVEALLKADSGLVFNTNKDGWTPLFYGVLGGKRKVVEVLLENGAKVNVTDTNGATPLHQAAFDGHVDITELLLTNGAQVNATNHRGETPLLLAAMISHDAVAALLIANKANVNAKDNKGTTPLHYAASRGDKPLAELLLAHGADVNARDDAGHTPLQCAIPLDTTNEIAELNHEIEISTNCNGKVPPLLLDSPREEVAKLLLQHGAKE
jgi:ankyrin repeat protein